MNEDQISDLITHLEKVKDENEKMTLVAAKAYADRSGKPVLEILNLMKEEKWLTADEAKEWGFVDEVYNTTTTKINLAKVSEKFNMMGLPKLPDSSASDDDSLVGKVVSGIREFFSKENTLIFTQSKIDQKPMKQFTLLNSILAVTSLESQDGKGAYLNEAQLQAFEDAISGKDNRITELTQHETNYNNAVDKLNALHPDVASAKDLAEKVNVLSRKLAEKPGVPASGQSENLVQIAIEPETSPAELVSDKDNRSMYLDNPHTIEIEARGLMIRMNNTVHPSLLKILMDALKEPLC